MSLFGKVNDSRLWIILANLGALLVICISNCDKFKNKKVSKGKEVYKSKGDIELHAFELFFLAFVRVAAGSTRITDTTRNVTQPTPPI